MKYEHYFTYFYDGEEPIKYKVAEHAKFERDKAKMVLTFDLPLSKPKPVTRDSLRVLILTLVTSSTCRGHPIET